MGDVGARVKIDGRNEEAGWLMEMNWGDEKSRKLRKWWNCKSVVRLSKR